jgi:hypothetical protein
MRFIAGLVCSVLVLLIASAYTLLNMYLVCIYLICVSCLLNFCFCFTNSQPATFISAVLLVTSTMLRIGLPHVNVLTKVPQAFLLLIYYT